MKNVLQAVVLVGFLLVFLLPLYIESLFFFPFVSGENFPSRIIVNSMFASWILLALLQIKYRPKISRTIWFIGVFISSPFWLYIAANRLGSDGLHPVVSFESIVLCLAVSIIITFTKDDVLRWLYSR